MNPHDSERDFVIEPEYQLFLIDPGSERAKVIILVRQKLGVTPAEARHRIEKGEVLVEEGLSHWEIMKLKAAFEALGAVVRVKREK